MTCDNCGEEIPVEGGFMAPAFDMEMVCPECVRQYLKTGEWPASK